MRKLAFQQILFVAGIGVLLLGVYFSSQTPIAITVSSLAAMAIIGVGAFLTSLGAVWLLGSGEPDPDAEKMTLPDVSLPLVYGGFIGALSLIPALVVGHYAGGTKGLMTFIAAFIIANVFFGLPLALARSNASR